MIMLLLMLVLNFAVSWVNCWSVGRSWKEARTAGGWPRLLAWCGAIQAAIGFSSVVGFFVGGFLHLAGALSPAVEKGAISLWYLLVILPLLSTGLVILVESWRIAARERSWGSMGAAAYNTAAMGSNLLGAADGINKALEAAGKVFDGEDQDASSMVLLMCGLVACALSSGVLLAMVLIRHYATREQSQSFARA